MNIVFLCALGVGGATVLGAIVGFFAKGISRRFSDIVLSFAAGIMLSSSVISLILPSMENGEKCAIITTFIGIILGAVCLTVLDHFIPNADAPDSIVENAGQKKRGVMLFVLAIAIHNLPEGIASGVGLGTGNIKDALLIAGGIALQNLPEGMVIINPMLSVGIKPWRAFFIAALTGLVEVVGTILGYFTVRTFSALLPFSLAFAGGTMLYIIIDEIIPMTGKSGRKSTYALLFGFLTMLLFDALIG